MKRDILIHPDPRLKKLCDPVGDLTDDLRQLADDMLETMYAAPGVGLAAPQVGVLSRLIVLDCVKEEGAPPRPLIMRQQRIGHRQHGRQAGGHVVRCCSTWAESARRLAKISLFSSLSERS